MQTLFRILGNKYEWLNFTIIRKKNNKKKTQTKTIKTFSQDSNSFKVADDESSTPSCMNPNEN